MTDHPWESEPDSLDFETDGLSCAMRRSPLGVWCGYVGVEEWHPLYGLPINYPLKLPADWFKGRSSHEGFGQIDLLLHAMSGAKSIGESCPIGLAFEVHGGLTYADGTLSGRDPGRWWFGFDCGHAGDYVPAYADLPVAMLDHLPDDMRDIFRKMARELTNKSNYRNRSYVVSECQSLASQLNAIVSALAKEKEGVNDSDDLNGNADDRRG